MKRYPKLTMNIWRYRAPAFGIGIFLEDSGSLEESGRYICGGYSGEVYLRGVDELCVFVCVCVWCVMVT